MPTKGIYTKNKHYVFKTPVVNTYGNYFYNE